jgi:peroxiredoxin
VATPAVRPLEGDLAPDFSATRLDGAPVTLGEHRGRPVWLAFFRWAQCPLCNFRIHQLLSVWDKTFGGTDLTMLGVFQSPAAKLEGLVERHKPPFIPIPDPDMLLYQQYGLGTSMKGLLGPQVRAALSGARAQGIPVVGPWDGPALRTPADLLIDREGVVRVSFYGENIADHIPFERVSEFLASA